MKTIIVPIDFSDESINAFKYAAKIAKKVGANVIPINIIEPTTGEGFSTMAEKPGSAENDLFTIELMKKNKTKLAGVVKVEAEDPSVVKNTKVYVDFVHRGIENAVDEFNADALIMGSKHYSTTEKLFTTTNTLKTIRDTEVPVIAVPTEATFTNVSNITFPFAFDEEIPTISHMVADFANTIGAKVNLVHVMTSAKSKDDKEVEANMEKFAKESGFKDYTTSQYDARDEDEGILKFNHDKGGELITLMTHGRNRLQRWISGSIAEEVLEVAPVPVMALNIKIEHKQHA